MSCDLRRNLDRVALLATRAMLLETRPPILLGGQHAPSITADCPPLPSPVLTRPAAPRALSTRERGLLAGCSPKLLASIERALLAADRADLSAAACSDGVGARELRRCRSAGT